MWLQIGSHRWFYVLAPRTRWGRSDKIFNYYYYIFRGIVCQFNSGGYFPERRREQTHTHMGTLPEKGLKLNSKHKYIYSYENTHPACTITINFTHILLYGITFCLLQLYIWDESAVSLWFLTTHTYIHIHNVIIYIFCGVLLVRNAMNIVCGILETFKLSPYIAYTCMHAVMYLYHKLMNVNYTYMWLYIYVIMMWYLCALMMLHAFMPFINEPCCIIMYMHMYMNAHYTWNTQMP